MKFIQDLYNISEEEAERIWDWWQEQNPKQGCLFITLFLALGLPLTLAINNPWFQSLNPYLKFILAPTVILGGTLAIFILTYKRIHKNCKDFLSKHSYEEVLEEMLKSKTPEGLNKKLTPLDINPESHEEIRLIAIETLKDCQITYQNFPSQARQDQNCQDSINLINEILTNSSDNVDELLFTANLLALNTTVLTVKYQLSNGEVLAAKLQATANLSKNLYSAEEPKLTEDS